MTETVLALREALTLRLSDTVRLTADTDLIAEGLLDSLLIMDLMTFVEGRFGVRLGPQDVTPETFQSLSALAAVVDSRLVVSRAA